MRLLALLAASLALVAGFSAPVHTACSSRVPAVFAKAAATRFEVCQNKYCRKKGAAATLRHFQELSKGVEGVEVLVADMSHTEHGCFDECTMGPNVRLDGQPKSDGGKVVNGVKGAAAVAELLGVELPDGYQ